MPAKRTFLNLRVRGVAQFDGPVIGIPTSAPSVPRYVALLSIDANNNILVNVLENTLGGIIDWGVVDGGYVEGYLTGAFPEGKTHTLVSNGDYRDGFSTIYRTDDDIMGISYQPANLPAKLSVQISVYE